MYKCFKHNLNSKGWNSHVHRGFPGNSESTNLSRGLSREIGRTFETVACLTLGVESCERHISI